MHIILFKFAHFLSSKLTSHPGMFKRRWLEVHRTGSTEKLAYFACTVLRNDRAKTKKDMLILAQKKYLLQKQLVHATISGF